MMTEQSYEKLSHFDAIRIELASPEHILSWSHGEVTKPETINYRTQKPERAGLFAEEIFGPTKDYECYCGKYKKVRYKGIICDKCGVQVTRSIVRRERMGHIKLAAPVVHTWYLRGVPSRIGMYLGLSIRDLEKVVYFASFIVKSVEEDKKKEVLAQLKKEMEEFDKELKKDLADKKKAVDALLNKKSAGEEDKVELKKLQAELKAFEKEVDEKKIEAETVYLEAKDDISRIAKYTILSEGKYAELKRKYGSFFEAGIGAEAIYDLIREVKLEDQIAELEAEREKSTGQKKKKVMKRLRFMYGLRKADIDPAWMIMTYVAVTPPELRPMVQLDGGRFATADLNDLYRRVINRNNRLKRLKDLHAPEVIQRNEKRMLQEAVDALIGTDSARSKTAMSGSKKKLKSLSEALKGKQGRFRQNLLGKRVDYSGRSVIVVGPNLKLNECGLPKIIALELFKPFIISGLISRGLTHSAKSAGKLIEQGVSEVFDILEEVTEKYYVLLNRAPTLHRLGIQAFKVKLIEGKAIQLHPLVCGPFNADFDGDQMAVHLPLSSAAQSEASGIMVATRNLLKPADGRPAVTPSQDMVLGCYYLTMIDEYEDEQKLRVFSGEAEAQTAYDLGQIRLRTPIRVRINGEVITTTIGRVWFNAIIPAEYRFVNQPVAKGDLEKLIARSFKDFGIEATAGFVDQIKDLGMKGATLSGITLSMADIKVVPTREKYIQEAETQYSQIDKQYRKGLITLDEKNQKTIALWREAKAKIEAEMMQHFDTDNPLSIMMTSKARGDKDLIAQLVAMRGVLAGASGRTIPVPVKSTFRSGLSVLEYFISSHGARKGLTDTALRTSDAGYLTRRLVDVAQDVIISEVDCGTDRGLTFSKSMAEDIQRDFARPIDGRILLRDITGKKGKVLLTAGTELTPESVQDLVDNADVDEVHVRSVLECASSWGVCQSCYGRDLARGALVEIGEAVGIIAAQSIGEPGTQLTMRTFHSGGIAKRDITSGLPRIEELFEARTPKGMAVITEIDGVAHITTGKDDAVMVKITATENKQEFITLKKDTKVLVKDGEKVTEGQSLIDLGKQKSTKAQAKGTVKIEGDKMIVTYNVKDERDYMIEPGVEVAIEDGATVAKGDRITEGHIDPHQLMDVAGSPAVKEYIIKDTQEIYESQGQSINDKHIEIIIRQMFGKVRVEDGGASEYLEGEMVSKQVVAAFNATSEGKKKPIIADEILLGVTKASLNTESFLSAASFQETTSVLIDAATQGKIDYLKGLKENTILGKLIPAGTGFRKMG